MKEKDTYKKEMSKEKHMENMCFSIILAGTIFGQTSWTRKLRSLTAFR